MGECFFWYQPTPVVLDKGPLNGCVCAANILVDCWLNICVPTFYVFILRNGCLLAFSQSTVVHPLSLIPATKNDRLAMHNLQFNSNSILRKTVIAITTTI